MRPNFERNVIKNARIFVHFRKIYGSYGLKDPYGPFILPRMTLLAEQLKDCRNSVNYTKKITSWKEVLGLLIRRVHLVAYSADEPCEILARKEWCGSSGLQIFDGSRDGIRPRKLRLAHCILEDDKTPVPLANVLHQQVLIALVALDCLGNIFCSAQPFEKGILHLLDRRAHEVAFLTERRSITSFFRSLLSVLILRLR